jgi:membrane-bound ClpP family serine protease
MEAKTTTELAPGGSVIYVGEIWKAKSAGEHIPKDTEVRIIRKKGLTLIVEPIK